jgi:hypothetical protein
LSTVAIPQPEPRDWQIANANQLQVTDREVLRLLRDAKKRVDEILKDLEGSSKNGVLRSQLMHTRALLLAEQSSLFERLGDKVAALRAQSASRAARLSAAADDALLRAVGKGAQSQFLYQSALQVSQRAIDAALARMRLSQLPLSKRIYNTGVWMNGRLGRLINETLATGLDARAFAKRARDWFSPNTPGGVRYAAMRLARTEINNAFHAISAEKYANTPWTTSVDWNLSKSHPKPDICNTLAQMSPFAKEKVPARPHPQCMCYITANYLEEDDFIDAFLKGDYDDYLDAELTKNGWNDPPVEEVKRPAAAPQTIEVPRPTPTIKSPDLPAGDGKPEFTSLEAAGLLDVGSEFLYHGDTRKDYRIIPRHVRVAEPVVKSGPKATKARSLVDAQTGELVGQQASSSAKWWIERLLEDLIRRRDDPDYKRDYERGWKAGAGRNDLTAADRRNESDPFYDGFSDRSIGAPKWTRADERDEADGGLRKRIK